MLAPWCELERAEPLIAQLGGESIAWWRARFPGAALNGSLVGAHGRDAGELAQFGRRTERFEGLDGAGVGALEPDPAGRFNKGRSFTRDGKLVRRGARDAR